MSEDIAVDLNALAREQEKPELKFSWSPEGIDKFFGALAKAQGAMKSASKDSANPFYNSKYADLAAIVEAIKKPLSDNELAYVQPFTTLVGRTNSVTVITMIGHSSGQWMKAEATFPVYAIPPKGQPINPNAPVGPQAFGSAETYLRRYALQSVLGLPTDDDDGNKAEGLEKDDAKPKQSASEVVRGAVARPNTASARKSDTKEAPTASQSDDLMRRVLSFSDKATKAGMKTPEIREYAAKVLGHKHPSVEFTSEDMDLLEAAWAKRDK